jgi:hypothetical protein
MDTNTSEISKTVYRLSYHNGPSYYDPGGRRILVITAKNGSYKMIRQPCTSSEWQIAANGKWA